MLAKHVVNLMAFLQYLKPAKDCLPDPQGPLAGSVPSHAITSANLEVQQLLADDKKGKKRGPYKK